MTSAPDRTESGRRSERGYRHLALALMLVFPAVYLARGFIAKNPEPLPPSPRLVQLFVITAGEWPSDAIAPDSPLSGFATRAACAPQTYAPARSAVGAVVSLWTGRYPMSHGVREAGQRLPADTWSLASAARSRGSRTTALLQEPLIATSGLTGFERVLEDTELTVERALELARPALDAPGEERSLVWLHFATPTRAELARLVDGLRQAALEADRAHECLTVLTGLHSAHDETPDARARVPLFVELPGGTAAGLVATGSSSLVDLAGALCELLGLPLPAPGAPALQSRGSELWRSLNGGGGFPWLFLEGQRGDILRFGRTRVSPRADGTLEAEQTLDPRSDSGFRPAPRELAREMKTQYAQLVQALGN